MGLLFCNMVACVDSVIEPENSSSVIKDQIVEKSKKIPPYWIDQKTNSLIKQGNNFLLVIKKEMVVDVSLGIKQTLTLGPLFMKNLITEQIIDSLHRLGFDYIEKSASKDFLIKSTLGQIDLVLQKESIILDIYYETYLKSLAQTAKGVNLSTVYILAKLKEADYKTLLTNIAQDMQSSQYQDLRDASVKLKSLVYLE